VTGGVGWKPVANDAAVASARIRCFNPVAELRRRGLPVEVFVPGRAYATVVFSKRYDAGSVREAEALKARGARLVFDLCDNHFHVPPGQPALAEAARRLRAMLELADVRVVSTDALAEVVSAEMGDGRPVTVVGDAVEDSLPAAAPAPLRWLRRRDLGRLTAWLAAHPDAVRLVWFGVAGGPYGPGGVGDLARIAEPVAGFSARRAATLTIISNSAHAAREATAGWPLPVHYLEWRAETFYEALALQHVALIPVTPTPFTRCKSNNRVATALARGLAVVADAIPSYEPFRPFAALDDWAGGLGRYADPGARRADLERGAAYVRERWTIGPIADAWQRVLEAAG
jgi:hypothetical protein